MFSKIKKKIVILARICGPNTHVGYLNLLHFAVSSINNHVRSVKTQQCKKKLGREIEGNALGGIGI